MDRPARHTILTLCLLTAFLAAPAHAKELVEGYWMAKSPFFGKTPIGLVKTYMHGKELRGQLLRVYPLNGRTPQSSNPGNGPIMMYGFHKDGSKWTGGMLYEQITAKIYKGTIKVSEDGEHMKLTGRKGIFYRSTTWDRVHPVPI